MSRDDKFIRKMQESPRNIRFAELERFLKRQGFEPVRQQGSHVQYRRAADRMRLSVAKPHGGNKTVHPDAIKEILRALGLEKESGDG